MSDGLRLRDHPEYVLRVVTEPMVARAHLSADLVAAIEEIMFILQYRGMPDRLAADRDRCGRALAQLGCLQDEDAF